MHYLYLLVAIIFETVGTSFLQASHQFTRLFPSIGAVIGFAGALYFMGLTLKYMPVGVVYAIWSGLGIILIATIGFVWFKQTVDLPAIIGFAFIIAGIVIIQLFSDTVVR